jgi:hypothetical protein
VSGNVLSVLVKVYRGVSMRRSFHACSLAPAPPCHCLNQSFAQRRHTAHITRKAALGLPKLAAIGGVRALTSPGRHERHEQRALVLGLARRPALRSKCDL